MDEMSVEIVSIDVPTSLQQSVWTGTGHVLDEDGIPSPDLIKFGGDWRAMREIKYALDEGENPIALVPSWAVMARIPA